MFSLDKFGEALKTEAIIFGQVIRGEAFVDTLIPGNRNKVSGVITRANGSVEEVVGYNTRVDAGALWQATLMGSAAGTPCSYLALSANSLTIAKTDTTLAGEITTNGLARTAATYGSYTAPTSLGGPASFQFTKTFTATGSQTVNSAALLNGASGGSMFVEANLASAATLAAGDMLSLTWTVNI